VVEHLPSKFRALSSNPSTEEREREREREADQPTIQKINRTKVVFYLKISKIGKVSSS
jgi:hypothetical protein